MDQENDVKTNIPKFSWYGKHETGRETGIHLSKGHSDEEPARVGHYLAEHHALQVRSLPNNKIDRAYNEMLQVCIEHQVPLSDSSKASAIKKLQQFFRRKAPQKKSGNPKQAPLDLKGLSYVPKTFMVENGPFLDPMPTWSAGQKGLAVASLSDIMPVINQGKLLVVEYNSVPVY